MHITFSGTLLRFVNFQKTLQLDAATVRDALSTIAGRFPQVGPVIYDAQGQVRQVHQLFLNGRQLAAAELDQPLVHSDRLDLLTAIAGG